MTKGDYRPDIDGLRAIAVLLVLFYHAFPDYLGAGFIGVDVFFVISGYLITGNLLRRRPDESPRATILDFYRRRIRRIFPALFLVLVSAFIYGWFVLFPTDFDSLKRYIVAGAAFVTNFALWREAGYFDQRIELKPLMHLWSLAIEEQFYIVWPPIILALCSFSKGRYLIAALATAIAMSFAYCLYLTASDPSAAYYSPLSRGWELGVGGLLAAMPQREWATRYRSLIASSAIGLLIAGAFLIDHMSFPGWQAMIPVAASAAIIGSGRGSLADRYFLRLPILRYIGLISYPLYLWHWLVLSFLRLEISEPSAPITMVALLLSVILAAATYRLVEQPIRGVSIHRSAILMSGAMASVFSVALLAYVMNLSGVVITPLQKKIMQEVDARPAYRYSTCFLDTVTQTASDFAPECLPRDNTSPTILLWGDSLAAQFYPGLSASSLSGSFTIAQTTATSCPAAVDDRYSGRGSCNKINEAARSYISSTKPAVVLINGRWSAEPSERESQISSVVRFLRDEGVKNVVLAGPAPDWVPDLRQILLHMRSARNELPEYMKPPAKAWAATKTLNSHLSGLASELGIGYLSVVDHFCRGDECRLAISDDVPSGLVTTDHDHLTEEASVSLFNALSVSDLLVVPRPRTSATLVPSKD